MRAATVVRLGMGVLGAIHAYWGAWAWLFPQRFFDTFPGFGHRWTAAYPPYNEHLVTDLGATFLTLAFLLAAGALVNSRAARWIALVAVAGFNTAHLSYHALHRGLMGGFDGVASLTTLVLGVLVPMGLLGWDRWARAGWRPA